MTGYNGWTNRETWLVNLWIDNDPGTQEYFRGLVVGALRDADGDRDEVALVVRDALKDWLDESVEAAIPGAGLMHDLLQSAVGLVDLRQIVYRWIEDAEEELADS